MKQNSYNVIYLAAPNFQILRFLKTEIWQPGAEILKESA